MLNLLSCIAFTYAAVIGLTNHSAAEIEAIIVELAHASKTTNKLTDSSRINGIPQRFAIHTDELHVIRRLCV